MIADNPSITNLGLECKLGDDEAAMLAEALKTNKTFTTFDFADNKIGDEGAKAIDEALKTNKTITDLHLNSNSIGDEGLGAIIEMLKENSTLTKASIGGNPFSAEGMTAFGEAFAASETIDDFGLGGPTDGEALQAFIEAGSGGQHQLQQTRSGCVRHGCRGDADGCSCPCDQYRREGAETLE